MHQTHLDQSASMRYLKALKRQKRQITLKALDALPLTELDEVTPEAYELHKQAVRLYEEGESSMRLEDVAMHAARCFAYEHCAGMQTVLTESVRARFAALKELGFQPDEIVAGALPLLMGVAKNGR